MVCGLLCLAIRYATSYNAVRIGLSMGAKQKTCRVPFSSYMALFFNSASVVFLYFHRHASLESVSLVLPVLS